jgi:hypothetical protein
MSEYKGAERRRWRGGSGGCGCVSFFFVLTVGVLLSLFDLAIGAGGSIRIPFTSANFTVAGSVGEKDKAPEVLPPYVHGRLGSNHDFVNQSNTLTIWVAEGTFIVVLGHQEGAPVIDLHLEAR